MTNVLIGCDPEYFVKVKGKNVSAHGLVDGDKENPLRLEGGAVQVDGTALEFNIDPASTKQEFLGNIETVLEQIRELVPDKYEFVFDPVAQYSDKEYAGIPAEARILGCEPDFNAYTGSINNAPDAEVKFRTAAGHVHFGWTEGRDPLEQSHFQDSRSVTAMADYLIGFPLAVMEPNNIRKELYGKAGAFRPKSYGCEWRTSSNFWLQKEELRSLVYDQAVKVIEILDSGKFTGLTAHSVQGWLDTVGTGRDYIDEGLSAYRKAMLQNMETNKTLFSRDLYDYVAEHAYVGD